jgi:hypothetical protein
VPSPVEPMSELTPVLLRPPEVIPGEAALSTTTT